MLKYSLFRPTVKYVITPCIPKPLQKNLFSSSIRMSGKNVNFGDKEIKKIEFYKNRKVTKIDDIDVNKKLVSKKEPYCTKNSFKYFIGYNDNDFIRPLCIKLLQNVRKFEDNTTMSFKINDSKLLKKYNQMWKRVERLLKIEFDSKPVYGDNDTYIKTKTKIFNGCVNTIFKAKKCHKQKHHSSLYQ